MSNATIPAKQQQRRGTYAQWAAANPILAPGELGIETDTWRFKLGDGVTPFLTLPYYAREPQVQTADLAGATVDLTPLDHEIQLLDPGAVQATVRLPENGPRFLIKNVSNQGRTLTVLDHDDTELDVLPDDFSAYFVWVASAGNYTRI